MEPIEIFFLIASLILIVVAFLVKEQRLNDPENSEMIFIDQLGEACKLRDGPVSAVLVRQSGTLYRDLGRFDGSEAAIEQILKSFRRAKIESVFLKKNTLDEFSVIRLHHSYGGSANGKKTGRRANSFRNRRSIKGAAPCAKIWQMQLSVGVVFY